MKSRILLFVVFLFLSVFEVQSQPGPYRPFSLDDQCLSFDKDEIVFFGRIVSIEQAESHEPLPDILKNSAVGLKVTVSVEKVLNGKITKKKVDFFESVFREDIKVNDYRIFVVREITDLNKTKSFFISNRWSGNWGDLDKKQKNNLFSVVETRLKEILISAISGKVVQRIDNSAIAPLFIELRIDTVNTRDLFTPIEGITVEVIRLKDGKSFQTKTDENGDYKFNELEAGSYKIHLIHPKGFREVGNKNENVIYTIQGERASFRCYRQVFLELKQITK